MNFYVFPNLLQNTSVSYIIYCIYKFKLKKSSGLNLKIGSSLSGTSPFLDTNLTNHDMQLKHWLDQTEVELGRRLASRATSFLAAVSAQDQLKNILKEAQETAQSLRARVRQVGVSGTKSNFSGKQMFGRSYFFTGIQHKLLKYMTWPYSAIFLEDHTRFQQMGFAMLSQLKLWLPFFQVPINCSYNPEFLYFNWTLCILDNNHQFMLMDYQNSAKNKIVSVFSHFKKKTFGVRNLIGYTNCKKRLLISGMVFTKNN